MPPFKHKIKQNVSILGTVTLTLTKLAQYRILSQTTGRSSCMLSIFKVSALSDRKPFFHIKKEWPWPQPDWPQIQPQARFLCTLAIFKVSARLVYLNWNYWKIGNPLFDTARPLSPNLNKNPLSLNFLVIDINTQNRNEHARWKNIQQKYIHSTELNTQYKNKYTKQK